MPRCGISGVRLNSHECESMLVVPPKISWEFRRECASNVIVNFLLLKLSIQPYGKRERFANKKVKGRTTRLRRMALYKGKVRVGINLSRIHWILWL